ncbi:hypothetical protein JIG36_32120 [Actinoplanes sp. LDG1-06]|uniref:Uncharacterized protein n=1 Tax=Paractinoplanes ovalisporus TaxID=2810368 RepID=A0ABS2AK29_9ACTN|nr:hypothetical protein [Actinoplanes ovalisporus]MBM2620171.1 hypothetical protein [Actinoplanes ovalisporus]
MTALTLAPAGTPRLPGHLVEPDDDEVRRDLHAWLAVPCAHCRVWHMHPAGTARRRTYVPGDVTSRRGLCDGYPDGYDVVVQRKPLRSAWCSPHNMRVTSVYRWPAEFLPAADLTTRTNTEEKAA